MIPPEATFDPPLECTVDYYDEPNVTAQIVGWTPDWLYVLESRIKDYPAIVCMVAWGNIVGLRAEPSRLGAGRG